MVECPVCGGVSSPEQTACPTCGLPSEFIQAVRDLSEPSTATALAVREPTSEIQVVDTGTSSPETRETPAEPASPAPLEATDVSSQEPEEPESEFEPEDHLDPGIEALRIGRSLGIDLSKVDGDPRRPTSGGGSARAARSRRNLIHQVLDGLMDRYRQLCDRRNALPLAVRTQALDAELTAYRKSLSAGDIGRADELRTQTQHTIELIEASWNRIKTQIAEAGQMIRALREMGGVAPAVLRPVAEAIRIPERGEAAEIEHRLDRANGLLWGLLVPRMDFEISKGRSILKAAKASPARTSLISREIDRMTEEIRTQKIQEALESRRFLRAELASITPKPQRSPVRRSFIE